MNDLNDGKSTKVKFGVSRYHEQRVKQNKLLAENIEKINEEELKKIGVNFIKNLNNIDFMFKLPNVVLLFSIANAEYLIEGIDLITGLVKETSRETIEKEIRENLLKFKEKNKKIHKERLGKLSGILGAIWSEIEFERILNTNRQLMESHDYFLYAGIVWLWTLFETSVTNLWEISLNMSFDTIGKDVLKRMDKVDISIGKDEDLRGKYISINLLGKYNYDIKNNLGSILKTKCNFDTLEGIVKAYNYLFPKSVTIQKCLEENGLKQLSEDRNAIVHNAGLVDSKYKNYIWEEVKIGDKVPISGEHYDYYALIVTGTINNILNGINGNIVKI